MRFVAMFFIFLTGCALSPDQFRANRYNLPDEGLCRTWWAAARNGQEAFTQEVGVEARRRGLSPEMCGQIIGEANNAAAMGLLGAAAIAGAAANAPRRPIAGPADADWQWDWDYINGPNGLPVWVCRGVQTGQFADDVKCAGRLKNDGRWPGLGDPFRR